MIMLDIFKNVFGQTTEEGREDFEHVEPHDVRLAACALFLEMAQVDEEFSGDEREMILSILKDEYHLSEEHATALTEEAEKQRKESVDLWHFTNLINQNFSKDEKIRVVELLWKIVYVDGKLDKHEDYLVHTMANMLNLSHQDLIESKLSVLYDKE
jgi:uncharacterized tellurite resistance protein B-like protein